jgi:hypothetical protein
MKDLQGAAYLKHTSHHHIGKPVRGENNEKLTAWPWPASFFKLSTMRRDKGNLGKVLPVLMAALSQSQSPESNLALPDHQSSVLNLRHRLDSVDNARSGEA